MFKLAAYALHEAPFLTPPFLQVKDLCRSRGTADIYLHAGKSTAARHGTRAPVIFGRAGPGKNNAALLVTYMAKKMSVFICDRRSMARPDEEEENCSSLVLL